MYEGSLRSNLKVTARRHGGFHWHSTVARANYRPVPGLPKGWSTRVPGVFVPRLWCSFYIFFGFLKSSSSWVHLSWIQNFQAQKNFFFFLAVIFLALIFNYCKQSVVIFCWLKKKYFVQTSFPTCSLSQTLFLVPCPRWKLPLVLWM